jgi:short-subunit dehydrogenase
MPEPRRVLVTGASSGIGEALAKAYAARGDAVWLAARRADRLAEAVDAIKAKGGAAHAFVLDVGDPDACAQAVTQKDAEVGGFDLVIANAGVGGTGQAAGNLSWDDVRQVFMVNTLGAIATVLAAKDAMKARGRGHVVVVSSLAGEMPLPVAPDYGASKAGVSYFMEAAALDLPRYGVDVTLVHPGFVASEMTAKNAFPMPFMLGTDEAVAIIMRGIDRKKQLVRFPTFYVVAFALAKRLPRALVAKLATSQTKGLARHS